MFLFPSTQKELIIKCLFFFIYSISPRTQYLQKRRQLFQLGGRGSEPGCFTWPRGIAVGPDNSIVVADSSNHRYAFHRHFYYVLFPSFNYIFSKFPEFKFLTLMAFLLENSDNMEVVKVNLIVWLVWLSIALVNTLLQIDIIIVYKCLIHPDVS